MEKLSLGNAVRSDEWTPIPGPHAFSRLTLAETLLGGQAFRWHEDSGLDSWTGCWGDTVVRLHLTETGVLLAASPTGASVQEIRDYLGLDRLERLKSFLPANSDPVVATLQQRWGGLSLLQQPAGETLLAFICSANKQIIQIRRMLEALAEAHGEPITGTSWHALPGWDKLAEVDESALRACGLGYRAVHVRATARRLASQPDYLDAISRMSDEQARVALQALPGVGPKVAECVLLFGFGRSSSFPVDTWIARLMAQRYPDLAKWSREQIAAFGRIHYGPAAGLIQQWLFADRAAR